MRPRTGSAGQLGSGLRFLHTCFGESFVLAKLVQACVFRACAVPYALHENHLVSNELGSLGWVPGSSTFPDLSLEHSNRGRARKSSARRNGVGKAISCLSLS